MFPAISAMQKIAIMLKINNLILVIYFPLLAEELFICNYIIPQANLRLMKSIRSHHLSIYQPQKELLDHIQLKYYSAHT